MQNSSFEYGSNAQSASQTSEEQTKEQKETLPPMLERIAWCESKGQHFDRNGQVLRGKNPNDVGKYQINQIVWIEKARELGHDIHTEEGNEAMARLIFETEGTRAWRASRQCWDA